MHLACPQCSATNRLPDERLGESPKCGRCGTPLMAAAPVALSDASFDAFVGNTELPVVVDFWAEWCGPCRAMAPQFAAAAAQAPRVRFAKLDTEANPATSHALNIRSIPTLVLYQGGREVARRSGATSAGELLAWVRAYSPAAG